VQSPFDRRLIRREKCVCLLNQALYGFHGFCGMSKFECERSEDLSAELVDFAQRYLDLMRALAAQHGIVTIERQQPMNEDWKGERCFISPPTFFPHTRPRAASKVNHILMHHGRVLTAKSP